MGTSYGKIRLLKTLLESRDQTLLIPHPQSDSVEIKGLCRLGWAINDTQPTFSVAIQGPQLTSQNSPLGLRSGKQGPWPQGSPPSLDVRAQSEAHVCP